MIKLKEAVIVEGKYDKIKLSSLVDGLIITTDGFGIFKDEKKRKLIISLAKKQGIIILTDSDSAGFLIRSHIKGFVKEGKITNVFIPDIFGKERRKTSPSKEGKLGVEGMSEQILTEAFKKAGILPGEKKTSCRPITKTDLFDDGICGRADSKAKRLRLLKVLELPERMSSNALLSVLNSLYSFDEYKEAVKSVEQGPFCEKQHPSL